MTQKPVGGLDLVLEGIKKRFPGGVVALDGVNLRVKSREVVALLGENGSGKSTLVKIIYGIYTQDEGTMLLDGEGYNPSDPRDAISKGIVMVSQSPQLIERLTVAENLSLSLKEISPFSGFGRVIKQFKEYAENIGMKIDPRAKVWSLTYTQKQMVEIVRALMLGARLLILDEALTYLPLEERRKFYVSLRQFKERGGSVILITHKIPEALEFADRIVVLRRGKVVGEVWREETSAEKIRELMFLEAAKEISYEPLPPSSIKDEIVLEIRDLQVLGDYGELAVKGVSLAVRKGEVAGIAGVVGNGQRELLQAIVGLRSVVKGVVKVASVDVTNKGVKVVRNLGVGYIPDFPLKYGVSQENSLVENVAALFERDKLLIDWGKVVNLSKRIIQQLNVLTPSEHAPTKILSGGNLMKVVVGREIEYTKTLLIAYNPTRALDEVTAICVRKMIKQKASDKGVGVLFASEDLDEVYQLSDTIYVMNTGKIAGPFDPRSTPREHIEKLMVG